MMQRTPVLIVGAGPVGLAFALVLGNHGVPSIVCERRDAINPHPRAHVVSTRSMELFRSWGIADQVKDDALDPSWLMHFVWKTTLAGEELGRVSLDELPEQDILRRMFASAEGLQSCAQDRVEQHLLDAVLAQGIAEVRYGANVVGLQTNNDEVQVTLEASDKMSVLAEYVVGADGSSSWVREQAGIKMRGMPPLGRQINVYFHADLRSFLGDRPGILYWAINSNVRGVFIAMDGANRWTFNVEYNPAVEGVEDYTPERCVKLLQQAIGANIDIDVRSVGTWTMSAETARTYSNGRIFLAGDAAHRFPPTGGLGMNTGLADADNLAWKIAAVVRGWGAEGLLSSYQAERKPVALLNAQQSVTNALGMAATGIGPDGAAVASRLESDRAEERDEERHRLSEAIAGQQSHFDALNLEIGYRYFSSPVVTQDGTEEYLPDVVARDFDTDAQPGARLPHVDIRLGSEMISTLDLVGPYMLLIVGADGLDWIEAFDATRGCIPARVFRMLADGNGVGEAAEVMQLRPSRSAPDDLVPERHHEASVIFGGVGVSDSLASLGIGTQGCLLVRPDGHVAFRSPMAATDRLAILDNALRRAVGN